MLIETYSVGVGDRFGREGLAQLRAFQSAEERGTVIVPDGISRFASTR